MKEIYKRPLPKHKQLPIGTRLILEKLTLVELEKLIGSENRVKRRRIPRKR